MPSAQAHPPDDDGRHDDGRPDEDGPVLLEDVDRALRESAGVAETHDMDAMRVWRTTLTRALEVLIYARSVLAGDVGILRHR